MEIDRLIKEDTDLKGGDDFNRESEHLTALYKGRARQLTRERLNAQGQGDPDMKAPFQSKLLRRLVHTVAVVWAQPPTRLLHVAGERLPDEDPHALLFAKVYQQGRINSYLKTADRWRALLGQVVLYFNANPRGRVEPRIFQPHLVYRAPDPTNQDDMSTDRAVGFCVRRDPKDKAKCVYHVWEQVDDGVWEARRVNGKDEEIDGPDALFDGRTPPFEIPPFLQIYDELPEGRAWVPIDETRSAFAFGQSAVMNDIAFLLKSEAHTQIAASGVDNKTELPDKWGPGTVWSFENPEARISALSLDPKLLEAVGVSRHFLEVFASGEGLPADYFLATRRYETGSAGRLRMQDLDARRQDQSLDAVLTELDTFEIVRAIHNAYGFGNADLPAVLEMQAELARPHFPVDIDELQKAWEWDLKHGLGSPIDYLEERHRISREQAILRYRRQREDLDMYPIAMPAEAASSAGGEPEDNRGRPPNDDGTTGPDADAITPRPHRAPPTQVPEPA